MEQHIRLMAALKMFELGKVSSGKAAELAGMSRVEFIETCGRYRVSVFTTLSQLSLLRPVPFIFFLSPLTFIPSSRRRRTRL